MRPRKRTPAPGAEGETADQIRVKLDWPTSTHEDYDLYRDLAWEGSFEDYLDMVRLHIEALGRIVGAIEEEYGDRLALTVGAVADVDLHDRVAERAGEVRAHVAVDERHLRAVPDQQHSSAVAA